MSKTSPGLSMFTLATLTEYGLYPGTLNQNIAECLPTLTWHTNEPERFGRHAHGVSAVPPSTRIETRASSILVSRGVVAATLTRPFCADKTREVNITTNISSLFIISLPAIQVMDEYRENPCSIRLVLGSTGRHFIGFAQSESEFFLASVRLDLYEVGTAQPPNPLEDIETPR